MADGDYAFDPSDGQLADVARSGAREWERDMAVWEADAEQLRLRQRAMVDVLWEAMQRGDAVTVTLGEHSFTGALTVARGDLAILETQDVTLAINVEAIDLVQFAAGGQGVAGDRTYGSLRAYAGMLEVEGVPVRLLGDHIDVTGRVVVVAEDHVLIEDPRGASHAVAWSATRAFVRSLSP